jgi:hypothetical protein
MLPYLQVTEWSAFERVWSFADRAAARRAYNTLVAHLTEPVGSKHPKYRCASCNASQHRIVVGYNPLRLPNNGDRGN